MHLYILRKIINKLKDTGKQLYIAYFGTVKHRFASRKTPFPLFNIFQSYTEHHMYYSNSQGELNYF